MKLFIVVIVASLIGCGSRTERVVLSESGNFVYVEATSQNDADIPALNLWLKENPQKKVVSFAGAPAHRGDVDGYIILFKEGDNSRQTFASIERPLQEMKGVPNLAEFAKEHVIVAFATVPSQSDIQSFTVCYEH